MVEEAPPIMAIDDGREVKVLHCGCHLKHVARFDEHDRRLDNMRNLFYFALALIVGGMGWLVIQGNSTAQTITRIEAIQTYMNKTDEELKKSMHNVHIKLDEHINQWREKNGNKGG